jgi:peroxiredoxin
MNEKLHPGKSAPDYNLLDTQASSVALKSLWANGPTLVTFLRHFG